MASRVHDFWATIFSALTRRPARGWSPRVFGCSWVDVDNHHIFNREYLLNNMESILLYSLALQIFLTSCMPTETSSVLSRSPQLNTASLRASWHAENTSSSFHSRSTRRDIRLSSFNLLSQERLQRAQAMYPASWLFGKAFITIIALLFISFYFLETMSRLSFNSTTMPLDEAYRSGFTQKFPPKPFAPSNPESNSANKTRILLVSAMFPLSKSKHTPQDYEGWVTNFLQSVTTEIYFFTTPDFAPIVQRASPIYLPITIDTNYSSPFEVPPLKGLEGIYARMHEKDRERRIHSPGLYAVWNAKPFLLDYAVKILAQSGRNYDYVFWNDAGSFRGQWQKFGMWPDAERLGEIWRSGSELTGTKLKDLVFFPICGLPGFSMRKWKEDMGPVDYEVSEGSFFGGSPSAMAWWSQVFYAYHDYYLFLGHFVGKDQTLINAIFLLFPERILTVWYRDPNSSAYKFTVPFFDEGFLGACGSEWWYYQFWLSRRVVQDDMREAWLASSMWPNWSWWKERQRCRLADVSSLRDLLRRRFGDAWVQPVSTVVVE